MRPGRVYFTKLSSARSQEEGQLVQVHVGRNVTDLAAVDGDLICKHARRRNLDGVSPVVVVVAKSVGEVQDCILGDVGSVGRNVEVSWFDCALRHGMRHQEEIKGTVYDFGLFHESVVDIGTLRRVSDRCIGPSTYLEEPLPDPLVHDDEGVLRVLLVLV